jgi:hypothetical protein
VTGQPPFERLTPEGSGTDVGLLLAPARTPDLDETCTGLLTTATPDRTNVLFVTTRPAERAVAKLRNHGSAEPNEVAIVSVGRASGPASRVDDPLVRRCTAVENPSNLTQVGIEVTSVLEAWKDDVEAGTVEEITVCVDSATALLQYADERTVFRFLAELIDLFRRADAWAHVHVDPEAHDRSTVSSLYQLFDVVIDRTAGTGPADGEDERPERDAADVDAVEGPPEDRPR